MPSYVISGPISGRSFNIESGQYIYVGDRGTITQNGTYAASSNGGKIYNHGEIKSNADTIKARGDSTIENNADASIISTSAVALSLSGGYGQDYTITNDGLIDGARGAISTSVAYRGSSGSFNVTNHDTGTIRADSGFAASLYSSGSKVSLLNNYGDVLGNAGLRIHSQDDTRSAIYNHDSGRIVTKKAAILDGDGNTSISNSGVIASKKGKVAISMGDGHDSVSNYGAIKGHVKLGDGNDYFYNDGHLKKGAVYGGDGNDVASIESGKVGFIGGDGHDTVYTAVNHKLHKTTEDVTAYGDKNVRLTGNDSQNTMRGNDGNNVIKAGGGNDMIDGGRGNDFIDGGRGMDVATFQWSGSGVTVNLARGFASGSDSGFDRLKSVEKVVGSHYNDDLTGSNGKNGLAGGNGNDVLKGLSGRDWLNGGSGNDVMYGGRDADTFVFDDNFGRDTIMDFDPDQKGERIDLRLVDNIEDFRDLMDNHITEFRGDTYIVDGANYIRLEDVTLAELDAGDFLF